MALNVIFRHRVEVRFRDCDAMGHINNAVYFTYLEQTRLAHWRERLGVDQRLRGEGVPGIILARAECDFKAQATHGDVLEVRLGVSAIGRTSFTYAYEVYNLRTAELVAAAKTVQVMFDYKTGRPAPIPDDIRALLAG